MILTVQLQITSNHLNDGTTRETKNRIESKQRNHHPRKKQPESLQQLLLYMRLETYNEIKVQVSIRNNKTNKQQKKIHFKSQELELIEVGISAPTKLIHVFVTS